MGRASCLPEVVKTLLFGNQLLRTEFVLPHQPGSQQRGATAPVRALCLALDKDSLKCSLNYPQADREPSEGTLTCKPEWLRLPSHHKRLKQEPTDIVFEA